MRRRRTAAPSLDAVDTALAETTDTRIEPLTSGSEANEPLPNEPSAVIATPAAEISGDEPAPAKPRRTRRPKAVTVPDDVANAVPAEIAVADAEMPVTEDAVPGSTPESVLEMVAEAEPAPEAPKRARRPRRAAAAPEAVAAATAQEALEPLLAEMSSETAARNDEAATPSDDGASLRELLAESEAILEEVIGEATPGEKSGRGRRNSRRGRGRGGNGGENPPGETPGILPVAISPLRKRGPRTIALTLPFPTLPVGASSDNSGDTESASAELSVTNRKRGVRIPRTLRRILTPDGAVFVSEAQAAALLGSVLVTVAPTGDGTVRVPVAPVFAPAVPEYVPLPAGTLERLPLVAVAPNNGVPQLLVNGAPVLPAFLFVNTEVADEPEVAREIAVRQIRRAYSSGVRLFTLLAHLPWKRKAGDRRFDSIDDAFALVAEHAPDALLLPRLIFSPPTSWERANPDEMATYANGETGDVSIGSDAFWDGEAKDTLRAAIEHLAEGDHAARTLGVFLEHGEWFQSKGVGADRSPANTACFREWLKYQYRDNEVLLRAAWYDGAVTFDTAEIPSAETFALAAASGNGTPTVFLSNREMRLSDFYAYTSAITADRITRLAAIAKRASGKRLVVAASYGYTLEIARPNCGHYALADVLESRHIDILTAPFSYGGRLPGGSAPLPVPVDSIHLAGKLFVAEDDTKTHLALRPTDDAYNPKIATEEGTRAVHARNVGTVLAKGCGISWMDLWGEGWLDDDRTWEHLGGLVGLMGTVAEMRRAAPDAVSAPHVAVFVDEQSLFDMSGDEEPAILPQLIGQHRDVFARAGASVGFYLLSDLLKPNFPTSARLFIFLNAFHLPVAIRTALQSRWQNDGRTFAWLFAPGVRESGNIAELSETIGIQLRLQPWGSRTGTVVTDGRFALTENAKGERFGEEKRVNPSLTVADPKAQILGEYVTSGNPSLAYRKHARWQSVFIGEREMPLPLVRGLYNLAGVPIMTPDDDAVQVAGDGFAVVHSARSGGMTLYSPMRTKAAVYDAVTGEPLAGDGYGVRIETQARATRLLVWAKSDELSARFGVGAEVWDTAPAALAEDELPARTTAFVFESGSAAAPPGPIPARLQSAAASAVPQPTRLYPVELSVSAEDIAQFEAALAGEIALLDKEGDESAESEANRKKRRRRRRGGRGEKDVTDETGTEESSSDEGGEGEVEDGGIDIEAADAVFALADLTQGVTGYDADALLPLSFGDEGEILPGAPSTAVSSGSVPFDPVADMMARLFAQPGRLADEPGTAAGEPEPFRRPTLDELLPFSEAPLNDVFGDDVSEDGEYPADPEETATTLTVADMVPLQPVPEAEPDATETGDSEGNVSEVEVMDAPTMQEADAEQPVGLLDIVFGKSIAGEVSFQA